MVEFSALIEAFNRLRSRAAGMERKGAGEFAWQKYETPFEVYETEFNKLLSVRSFLKERKTMGKVFVMDFMGAGRAVRDLAQEGLVDGGLSVTLNDTRSPGLQEQDETLGCDVLPENILYGTAIRHLREWTNRKNPSNPYFDLIMCSPGNGFVSFPNGGIGSGMIESLFNKGIKLLDPNGGTMIINLPMNVLYSVDLDNWIRTINSSNRGVEAAYAPAREYDNGEYIMKVVRKF